jgi:hypothetical protein
MDKPNQATIEAYDDEAETYILKTPPIHQSYHAHMLNWIDAALTGLPGRDVLEIGSATPRDATYIRKKGFNVQTSDASIKFVQHLKANKEQAILLNILTDSVPKGYDLIFANAVAPHFTYKDMVTFLTKVTQSMTSGQRVAFNVKRGIGENWINEKFQTKRFIHYWEPEDIKKLLEAYPVKLIFFESDITGDLPNHRWINIVIQKL